MSDGVVHNRRIFLRQIAAVAGAAPLALGTTSATAAAASASASASASSEAPSAVPVQHAWRFFNGDEARAAEAAVARLIPSDDTGPGASEAGVAAFIDLELAGAWGNGEQLYRQPPFTSGTPQQG